MKLRMTTTPVDPTESSEIYEASATLKDRVGLAIYVAKDLKVEKVSIFKELFTSTLYEFVKIAKYTLTKSYAKAIAYEKIQQMYLADHPDHYFDEDFDEETVVL